MDNRKWAGIEWWLLDNSTDLEKLLQDLKPVFLYIEEWFSLFSSKETAIRMILDRMAEQYADKNIMHFHTAKFGHDLQHPAL